MSVLSTPEPSSSVASSASSFSFLSKTRRGLTVSELTPDISHIAPNADIDEYPLIKIGRQLYLKADWLKLKRKRTSWVSDYGTYLVEVNERYEKKKICGAVTFVILPRKYSYTLLALLMQPTDISDKNMGLMLNLSL